MRDIRFAEISISMHVFGVFDATGVVAQAGIQFQRRQSGYQPSLV